ncbi:MAG: radical SAM protein [Deltaproteobacteria bacterium]|nr:MAG: radical SAM protein [Deltaproteobacteria bacterium]
MNTGDRYLILDCYVDEPACLGVPPFVAPYPRYVFGALRDAGVDAGRIDYLTIDDLRDRDFSLPERYAMAFVIGGAVVPGKYLGQRIGTVTEIASIIDGNGKQRFAVGGLVSRMLGGRAGGNAIIIDHDIETYASTLVRGNPVDAARTTDETARWAVAGAPVVWRHPGHPDLICEIESYRGCPRLEHCSFCSEFLHEGVSFRDESDILDEIDSLIDAGITRFRIGSQPDILQYGSSLDDYRMGFPRPSPSRVASLFGKLGERVRSGRIAVLNVDNGNPGTLVHFPDESAEILNAIAESVTPGDTLAMGIESFDDSVRTVNNLKVTAGEAIAAVELVNEIGGRRVRGIPVILPGVNLIHGLPGETEDTFKKNFQVLENIRDRGLLVKRINIRSLNPFPGTPASFARRSIGKGVRKRYEYYRERIRSEIDHVMLKRIYPTGTVLEKLRVEETRDGYSYGRQIASYPITAKIPVELERGLFVDGAVVSHRERSLSVLPVPIDVNALPHRALKFLPGVGTRGADRLVLIRPLEDVHSLGEAFPGLPEELVALMKT